MTILLLSTAQDAIDFADTMVGDGLWTAGRGKAKAERFARVKTLLTLAETLRLEILRREREAKPTAHVEQLVSDIALELSTLCQTALDDKTLRTLHFDPWNLQCVLIIDREAREELAETPLPLAA